MQQLTIINKKEGKFYVHSIAIPPLSLMKIVKNPEQRERERKRERRENYVQYM